MSSRQVTKSVQAMVQEYVDADTRGKALAMRELTGYIRALLDVGEWETASSVGGIVTTLVEHEQR